MDKNEKTRGRRKYKSVDYKRSFFGKIKNIFNYFLQIFFHEPFPTLPESFSRCVYVFMNFIQ